MRFETKLEEWLDQVEARSLIPVCPEVFDMQVTVLQYSASNGPHFFVSPSPWHSIAQLAAYERKAAREEILSIALDSRVSYMSIHGVTPAAKYWLC